MIKLSSNSIDELNIIFKKVKKDFNAKDKIRLNPNTCEYELELERPHLSKAIIAIVDKVLEIDEMFDEDSLFQDFTWMKLMTEVEKDKLKFLCLQPLRAIWKQIKPEVKNACFEYLCAQKEIEPSIGRQTGNKLVA